MHAAAKYVGNKTITVGEAEAAPPPPGHVQIEVAFTGICGTDLHVLHGSMDGRVSLPAVIGHEMSGRIAATGQGVEGWTAGDPVGVMPLDWCGTCPACAAGHQHICQNLNFIGIDSPGSLQTRWNVPEKVLVRLPESLRLDHAALLEPVAVAVHDVRRAALRPGEKAVVIGGGPIGLLIAVVARHTGAQVVVAEPDAVRRATAAGLGFEVLDPGAGDQASWVEEWTAGAGADAVFEVSGSAAAVLGAASLARVRGRLVIVAIHPQPRPVDLKQIFWRELTLLGARVYERQDFETAVTLLDGGEIPADRLITGTVPLGNVADAFRQLSEGAGMKVLVDCGGES
ncbi:MULTISPECIES: alcohol dehydrogenase catalytic domain-containing protein [unclassified Streptomyces]|uniref:zinc-dependent alcohol dehydrogenase n=1 Tax=unclassified Streptomyces TaxID=2593676 RepID=UPI002DDC8417|nr:MULTISPECIES: alcohol dehydrogenase catalytic domain-containing protein [unclassified Streptomyces]WSA97071.1 alcohol dehydrogenase catalytic domain-containing protein [Streptomyces sp. NBC_01795]WSB76561.1 alcohol dehydrogenase catalytic domain-containing protein [Streptomyces sp. NBC_01775]WSS17744.1 alcohol dehydrogenase catalytic domain-containing protein [Streptomyces sp. NBC_01186]WSS43995.1 alcohol dehydrogenase catalytic domain-containing protein [Streptomyces sp. NBC_01187]